MNILKNAPLHLVFAITVFLSAHRTHAEETNESKILYTNSPPAASSSGHSNDSQDEHLDLKDISPHLRHFFGHDIKLNRQLFKESPHAVLHDYIALPYGHDIRKVSEDIELAEQVNSHQKQHSITPIPTEHLKKLTTPEFFKETGAKGASKSAEEQKAIAAQRNYGAVKLAFRAAHATFSKATNDESKALLDKLLSSKIPGQPTPKECAHFAKRLHNAITGTSSHIAFPREHMKKAQKNLGIVGARLREMVHFKHTQPKDTAQGYGTAVKRIIRPLMGAHKLTPEAQEKEKDLIARYTSKDLHRARALHHELHRKVFS